MTTKPKLSPLQAMYHRIKAMDPMSAPNLMRRSQSLIKDNGDGTMTINRRLPFKSNAKPNGA